MKLRSLFLLPLALLGSLSSPAANAGGEFAVLVSPPRFEASVKTGATYRDIIEITNVGNSAGRYNLRTSDWELDAQGQATFRNHLASDSCRPWVAIERKSIEVKPRGKYRYRFQVDVPKGTPAGECRFAIMIEGEPQTPDPGRPLQVAGSIGVIVYVAHGGAAPSFSVTGTARVKAVGAELPALEVTNSGLAHGRLEGIIDAIDANGARVSLYPSSLPVLAGQKRLLALTPASESDGAPLPSIAYPITLQGKADFSGQRMIVDGIVIR